MTQMPQRHRSRVIASRRLSSTGYELTLSRGGLEFDSGRLITIHGSDATQDRSYTISSGENEEHLQVLYRYIPTGKLTPYLIHLQAGDTVDISGPYGEFVVRDREKPMFFFATGTGVAPCHSYIRTYGEFDLTLVHGTRYAEDLFYREEFERYNYYPCVSGEDGAWFRGRVTEFFPTLDVGPNAHFYLCGANEMIFDMHSLLKDRGVDDSRIFTEAYYYRLYT